MRKGVRNAIIAGAVTRISCRSISMDEAIQQTITKHEIEAVSSKFHADIRRDVEAALDGEWSGQVKQLEIVV